MAYDGREEDKGFEGPLGMADDTDADEEEKGGGEATLPGGESEGDEYE